MLKTIPSSRFRKDYVLMKRRGTDISEDRTRLITGTDKAGNPCRPSLGFFRGSLIKGGGMGNETKVIEIDRKRWVASRYYIYNWGIPATIDDSGYQRARQEFLSLFPEFSGYVAESYDPDPTKLRDARILIREQIRSFAQEERIWEEEVKVRHWDLFHLAHEALNRNMKDFLDEDFPPPWSDADGSDPRYERLEKRLAELMDEAKTVAERAEYSRAQFEVEVAGDIIGGVSRYCVPQPDPFDHQCHMYFLGILYATEVSRFFCHR